MISLCHAGVTYAHDLNKGKLFFYIHILALCFLIVYIII